MQLNNATLSKNRFNTKPVSKGRTFEVPYRAAELKKVQQLTT